MKTSPLPILLLSLILTSCDGGVHRLLRDADACLPEHADSADRLLSQVSEWRTLSSSHRAYYGLLQTKTNALQGRGVGSDSLIRQSYNYYYSHAGGEGSNASEDMLRLCGQSAFYFAQFQLEQDSIKNAEDLLRKAIRLSKEAEDWRTCYMAYQYLGTLTGRSNPAEGLTLLKQSLYIYNRCNDKPTNRLSILLDLGYNYMSQADFEHAASYFDQAMAESDSIGSAEKRSEVHRAISSLHFYQHDYTTALHYAKLGQEHLTATTRDASRFLLAETYVYCDSLSAARQIFEELKLSANKMIVYEAYRYLSQIATLQGDGIMAAAYGDSAITASETMYHDALSQKDLYYHDLIQGEMQNEQLRYQQRMTIMWVIVGILLLTLIIYISYRRLRIYIRHINQKRRRGLQIQRATNRQVQDLQEEVDVGRKELLKVQHITMEESRIYQQLRSGALNSLSMTPARWMQVEQLLDSCSDHFISRLKLKYPTISQSQLELCMLTRLGFSQNEIADFYLRSVEAIKSRRKKLKAEVFGEKGSATSLDDIIASF